MGRRPQDCRGAARAAAASRSALFIARAGAVGARSRSCGAFPSQQRRAGRAARLAGRSLAQGPAAIGRDHGQLSLPARRHRGQSRGLPRRGPGRCLLRGARIGARSVRSGLAGDRKGRGYVPHNEYVRTRRRYGPAVRHEALETTAQGSSAEAMREHNLRPALPPQVEIVSAAEGADLEYKMSIELLPDMPEPDFTGLGIERLVAEVPEEDLDRAIERLAESQRKTEPVDRPAESGDLIVVDFVGKIGDVEFPGGKGEDVSIELGAGRFIPGFEDQLTGAKAGEDRTIQVSFPADYGAPDLAGKDASFDVKVREAQQRLPAAINDSLAEAVGLENLAELRQEVRQRMQRDYDSVARQRVK